jgi:hypothetical protein
MRTKQNKLSIKRKPRTLTLIQVRAIRKRNETIEKNKKIRMEYSIIPSTSDLEEAERRTKEIETMFQQDEMDSNSQEEFLNKELEISEFNEEYKNVNSQLLSLAKETAASLVSRDWKYLNFDIKKNEREWNILLNKKQKIQSKISNCENIITSDLKLLALLSKSKKERKKNERDYENNSWANLEKMTEIERLTFFCNLFGPITGDLEYYHWLTTKKMGQILDGINQYF